MRGCALYLHLYLPELRVQVHRLHYELLAHQRQQQLLAEHMWPACSAWLQLQRPERWPLLYHWGMQDPASVVHFCV